ncbi:MAG: flagellin [Campylobacterota bacterium]|nr:flagellin [Campylobacterota bacterium]
MQISNDGLFNINQNLNNSNKVAAEVASGIQNKNGDVASASIASHLNAQVSSMSQGLANANDGISIMQIADGATSQLNENLQHLNELSIAYGNGILNDANRATLEQEFGATLSSMQDIIESTSFNGNAVFGSESTFNIGQNDVSTSIPSLDFSALSIDDQGSIEAMSKTLASVSSEIGSTVNALESGSRSIFETMTNTAAAASQMSETDYAKAVTELKQNSLQLEASTIAQAHKTTQMQQSIQVLLG